MKKILQPLPTLPMIFLFMVLPFSAVAQLFDYGDAPDPTYPTLQESGGARHLLGSGLFLGVDVDSEFDGRSSMLAIGDDIINDDEDGVNLTSSLVVGETAGIDVTASGIGMLDAWIDYNLDGDWADPGEQIFVSEPLVAGINSLDISVPDTAVPALVSFARFRISTVGGLSFDGTALDGEVEDYTFGILALDFGDAPDPTYPTLRASDGARHILEAGYLLGVGTFLGAYVDAEPDGQPGSMALGDNLDTVIIDEDGVTFTSALIVGEPASMNVAASEISLLDGWVDFNGDGDWADTGEQIFADQPLVEGNNTLGFTIPATTTPGQRTYARFRVSSAGGLSFDGIAQDGEVEDYAILFTGVDFGDAPDSMYPTLGVNDGARHVLSSGLFLGTNVDAEADGQPTGTADGDDMNGIFDDEDGVMFISPLIASESTSIEVVASAGGLLNAWIDYNSNGDWGDAGEQVFTNETMVAGTNVLVLSVPATATPTNVTFGRFRVSTIGGLSFDGPASDGEVEDYLVTIESAPEPEVDFGDAPDPTYPSLVSSDGARHVLGTGLFLGANVDAEIDGQPTVAADGDDTNGISDEEGVVLASDLIQGSTSCVDVVSSGPGLLDAWIDFDGSGTWGDLTGEQIFTSEPVSTGVTTGLCFDVPITAYVGPTYARFRLSQSGGLTPSGLAADGEVEDYALTLFQAGPTTTNFVIEETVLTMSNGMFSVMWDGESNVLYQLQSTLDLLEQPSQVWSNVGGPVPGPINIQNDSSTDETQKHYRVVIPFLQ